MKSCSHTATPPPLLSSTAIFKRRLADMVFDSTYRSGTSPSARAARSGRIGVTCLNRGRCDAPLRASSCSYPRCQAFGTVAGIGKLAGERFA